MDLSTLSDNSAAELTYASHILPNLSEHVKSIYTALQPNGSLIITLESPILEPEFASIRRTLLFSGFTKISQSDSQLTALKPGSTESVDVKRAWNSAIENPSDLINEDDLLKQDEEYKQLSSVQDCITKPKPCKNCNCGRAEEESGKTPAQMPSSSCGRCHLGDAYRCAGCPYRGTPAFSPGEAAVIDLGTQATEATAAKIVGGKVRIEI